MKNNVLRKLLILCMGGGYRHYLLGAGRYGNGGYGRERQGIHGWHCVGGKRTADGCRWERPGQ